jgi:hypothetical protein
MVDAASIAPTASPTHLIVDLRADLFELNMEGYPLILRAKPPVQMASEYW